MANRLCCVLLLATIASACGGGSSTPTAPTPAPTPAPAPTPTPVVTVTGLVVTGLACTASVNETPQVCSPTAPSGTIQLTATAQLSNATTQDVTSQAQWASSRSSVATVSASGLVTFTAGAGGETDVVATYQGKMAGQTIRVPAQSGTPSPGPPSLGMSLSASIDGSAWSATPIGATHSGQPAGVMANLTIEGFEIGTSNVMNIGVRASGPGTFVTGLCFDCPVFTLAWGVTEYTAALSTGSGTITLTTFTPHSAIGTFSFTGVAVLTGAQKVVTNGKFNVTY